MKDWKAFRPGPADLARIDAEVAAIPAIQQKLLRNHPQLGVADRVAHQYQIAGSRVELRIASELPANLAGVGLFEPDAVYTGIGRVSTGLGCPHLETDPDFLGLMLAFRTRSGKRVDFLAINHPGAPTDDHRQFMALLEATAEGAGIEAPFGSGAGQLDLPDLAASNLAVSRALVRQLGVLRGGEIALHVLRQTARTATSSSAYQSYWTGIVESGGEPGKFVIVPRTSENPLRALRPGERHLSDEWRARQTRGPITFDLHWLPFIDERRTPLTELSRAWDEQPQPAGTVTFPQSDAAAPDSRWWSALAAEIGANPGNWVSDRAETIAEPSTEIGCARKLAYRRSQAGRDALPEDLYAEVFRSATISAELQAALQQRRAEKSGCGHFDQAP